MPLLTTSRIPADFAETTAPANGITINYVRGGAGPTLVLLHGYPQTWYMWRKVLPALAAHFTVIAPDLRGAGGSDAPADGYGKSVLAEDVHQLLVGLDLADEVSVVGHDIGTMVAYAYAAAHRDSTRRLVLIDSPLADESLYEFPSLTATGSGSVELRVLYPPQRPARADGRGTRGFLGRRIRRLAGGGQGRR